jgi:GR25 family glycosyltransferase involved in LPS biosynthesis
MQSQFKQLRMPVLRWSAVDGQTLNVPRLAEVGIIAKEAMPRYYLPPEQKLFGTDLTDGGIGCALSHMQIWRDIIRRCAAGIAGPESVFLVVEDDCQFVEGFSEDLLKERLSHVPSDWELVYLGGQDLMRRQHNYEVASGVRRLYKGFRETTGYVINDAGAKACLEVCIPMHWQVDTHLNDMSIRDGLRPPKDGETDYTMRPRGYCLWPPIVSQERRYPTDIQTVEHD